VLTTAIPANAL